MAKTRIYELAKELGLESKEVVARAQELGLAVKTASSSLDEADSTSLRAALVGGGKKASDTKTADKKKPAQKPKGATEPKTETKAATKPKAEAKAEAEPEVEPDPDPEPDASPEPEAETKPPVEGKPASEDKASQGAAADGEDELELVEIDDGVTPQELARIIRRPLGEIIRTLLGMGHMSAAVSPIPTEALEPLGDHFGFLFDVQFPEGVPEKEPEGPVVRKKRVFDDAEADLASRPPVVTVMGHVDHGKTTLLDALRNTSVVEGEAGGITQHIGAYQTEIEGRKITFVDTPGHEAFTAMRVRGAEVTDIVVLVVAADDGIMPQTAEAISHAKAAGVTIIVAINKMDVEGANPNRVRAQLTEHELVTEDLGGDVIAVELSAIKREGLDTLLEMIDLVAQVEDFKANPKPAASGVVVEAELDKGRGPLATVVIQRGTLRQGDSLVAGHVSGRVRAMTDENGNRLKAAGPSTPVEIMGWSEVPTSGDLFEVMKNDKQARAMAAEKVTELRSQNLVVPTARERLSQLLESLRSQDQAELRLVLKADTQGSVEAIRDSVSKIAREGGRVRIVHQAVGGINENDVTLADATESIVIGFNVRPDANSRKSAEIKGIEIRTYSIIYELLEEIEQLLVGRLAPEEVEVVLGNAEVRALFKVPRIGTVAGCFVTDGKIVRGSKARLVRDGIVIYDGSVDSLRRFKEDVRDVAAGFECGIGLANFNDVKEGDVIEAYQIDEVAAT